MHGRFGNNFYGNHAGGSGAGLYQQGQGVGEVYRDGSSAYRNSTLGQGVIIDPNAGGSWQDKVFLTR